MLCCSCCSSLSVLLMLGQCYLVAGQSWSDPEFVNCIANESQLDKATHTRLEMTVDWLHVGFIHALEDAPFPWMHCPQALSGQAQFIWYVKTQTQIHQLRRGSNCLKHYGGHVNITADSQHLQAGLTASLMYICIVYQKNTLGQAANEISTYGQIVTVIPRVTLSLNVLFHMANIATAKACSSANASLHHLWQPYLAFVKSQNRFEVSVQVTQEKKPPLLVNGSIFHYWGIQQEHQPLLQQMEEYLKAFFEYQLSKPTYAIHQNVIYFHQFIPYCVLLLQLEVTETDAVQVMLAFQHADKADKYMYDVKKTFTFRFVSPQAGIYYVLVDLLGLKLLVAPKTPGRIQTIEIVPDKMNFFIKGFHAVRNINSMVIDYNVFNGGARPAVKAVQIFLPRVGERMDLWMKNVMQVKPASDNDNDDVSSSIIVGGPYTQLTKRPISEATSELLMSGWLFSSVLMVHLHLPQGGLDLTVEFHFYNTDGVKESQENFTMKSDSADVVSVLHNTQLVHKLRREKENKFFFHIKCPNQVECLFWYAEGQGYQRRKRWKLQLDAYQGVQMELVHAETPCQECYYVILLDGRFHERPPGLQSLVDPPFVERSSPFESNHKQAAATAAAAASASQEELYLMNVGNFSEAIPQQACLVEGKVTLQFRDIHRDLPEETEWEQFVSLLTPKWWMEVKNSLRDLGLEFSQAKERNAKLQSLRYKTDAISITCDPGFNMDALDSILRCTPCDIGFYRAASMKRCSPCKAEEYTDRPGAIACKPCSNQSMNYQCVQTNHSDENFTQFYQPAKPPKKKVVDEVATITTWDSNSEVQIILGFTLFLVIIAFMCYLFFTIMFNAGLSFVNFQEAFTD